MATKEMLKDLLERVEKIEKKLALDAGLEYGFKTREEPKKKWAEVGDGVWYLDGWGTIDKVVWQGNENDKMVLSIGNLFRTKEEAGKELEKRKAIQRVKQYIEDNFGVFEPDWGELSQGKFTPAMIWPEGSIGWVESLDVASYSPYGYLRSEKDAEQLIKDMETELLLIHKS